MTEKERLLLEKTYGEKLKEIDFDSEDFDADEFVETWRKEQKKRHLELFENEPPEELKEKLLGSYKGQVTGTIRTKAKKVGLKPEDLEGMSEAQMIDKILETSDNNYKKLSKSDNAELQQKIQELSEKTNHYENEKIPELLKKSEAEKQQIYTDLAKESLISDQLEGKKLAATVRTSKKIINTAISDKYDVVRDENNELVFYKKGTTIKATKGDKIMTPQEIVNDIIIEEGLPVQSNGNGGNGDDPKPNLPNNQNSGNLAPGVKLIGG